MDFSWKRWTFAGGVFRKVERAEVWILKNGLSGVLTAYPVDIGVMDWAIERNFFNIEKANNAAKLKDPEFIASFTTASQKHFHYSNGRRA